VEVEVEVVEEAMEVEEMTAAVVVLKAMEVEERRWRRCETAGCRRRRRATC